MPTDLNNDELIDVPLANLRPGELRRAFMVRAIDTEKKDQATTAQRMLVALDERKEADHKEHERQELEQREEALFVAIQEREREIVLEAEELDRRTIRLNDGRRAYVDGDRYRDGEGKVLHGTDRAVAEQRHLEQPNAATWQEHEAIKKKMKDAERLHLQIEDLKNAPDGVTDAGLTRCEKELARQTAAQPKDLEELPDYGSGDIASAFGLSRSFRTATAAASTDPSRGTPTPPVALATLPALRPGI